MVKIDENSNRIVIGDFDDLKKKELCVDRVNWMLGAVPTEPVRAKVKIRYLHPKKDATIHPVDGVRARVKFDEPVIAVAPGQAAVFYDGETVLGGGWIL